MVGALSIVRYRTAVKSPMDLAFMFWAIVTGIICGASISVVAIILAVVMTCILIVLDYVPSSRKSMILQISYENEREIEKKIIDIVTKYAGKSIEKSRNASSDQVDVIYELRIKDGTELTRIISKMKGVIGCSLVSYEGDR